MQYWIGAFAVALVVVIGYAGGPLAAVVTIAAFLVALFLLWARELGFKGAWEKFGLQTLELPPKMENWDRLKLIFADENKMVKACTVAVAMIALAMILPRNLVALVYLAAVAWGVFEVYRANSAAAPRPGTPIN
ncbi:hypothetical protein BJ123_104214 [Rhodopseudomonas thermotolerans]|jgi:hypothetical protein|uniref:Uncharacterized protein n=2 Tax=Rhodopseudomonas TaxID=1073 RepID=A0A336JM71_9BRAD|nr:MULTISPECIES: hypothetical protein [Rhodopseudomonas]RED38460.1 hypothetical protein BJ125_104214 [Rhodopseudomonas pentothenatexigens]REG06045.1 hypothetical protein BJ123_104214 [Rhodopseudomonas thermotolerans]SSW89913.1 hypothetical protein SAMN05892882_104214 [Rhodopseudomonas pentothenatexigens]